MILLGILFSIVVDVKANIFPDTFNFLAGTTIFVYVFEEYRRVLLSFQLCLNSKGKS